MRSAWLVLLGACAEPAPGQLPPLFQPIPYVQLVGLADDGLVDISACCDADPDDDNLAEVTGPGVAASATGNDSVWDWPIVTPAILPLGTPLSVTYQSSSAAIAIPVAFDITAPVDGATVSSTTALNVTWAPVGDAVTASMEVDADFTCPSGVGATTLGWSNLDLASFRVSLEAYSGCSMTLHVIHETSAQGSLEVKATQVRDVHVTVSP